MKTFELNIGIRGNGIDPLRVVDTRTYTDPAVFEAEQEHIFAREWIFACHESEIRNPGDYVTLTVAGSPIFVTRDDSAIVRAFYNTCRHRGAQVLADECGHAREFRCPYHAWVYAPNGELLSVPGEDAYAYEGSGFSKDRFGLVPVRADSIHGLVFVCLDRDAPTLAEFLGNAVEVLARPLATARLEVMHRGSYPLRANWKCYAENARDGYHVPFVHPDLRQLSRTPLGYSLLDNGHAVQHIATEPGNLPPEEFARLLRNTLPGASPGEGYVVQIYPHLLIVFRNSMIGIESVYPLDATQTRMESRALGLVGDDDEVRADRLATWERWVNRANRDEDVPILERQQRGLRSRGVPFILMNRGSANPEGVRGDDNRLRHFWARWRAQLGTTCNSLA